VSAACLVKEKKRAVLRNSKVPLPSTFARAYLSHLVLFFLISIKHCRREIFHDQYIGGGVHFVKCHIINFCVFACELIPRAPPTDTKRQPAAARKKASTERNCAAAWLLCRLRYIFAARVARAMNKSR
jgi:hypothetical protein